MYSRDSVERESEVREKPHKLSTKKRKLEISPQNQKETITSTQLKITKQSGQSIESIEPPNTNITGQPHSGSFSGEQDVRSDLNSTVHHQDEWKSNDDRSSKDHVTYSGGRPGLPRTWMNLKNIMMRRGPFQQQNFKPSSQILEKIKNANILIVGAGGLGCEILKNLAMMGFENLSVIDMDTVDLSNLNRQFLFRRKDIGRPKVEVAAEYIRKRISGCNIRPFYNKIEDFDQQFYQKYHAIVCGLDSLNARRWLNGMLLSLLSFDEENDELNYSTVIPLIDGGSEGLKGNSRVILPGISPCIDCIIDLYPPQTKFHLCTLANTPRLPEHCVEYVKLISWPKSNPWGKDAALNEDDPQHLQWIHEKSRERANLYGIQGLNYGLVVGVLKNIIPAVASTNAVIGAVCATETFKVITHCFSPMNNHLYFNDADGVYTHCCELERKELCSSCSNIPCVIEEDLSSTLENLINTLRNKFKVKNPTIRANIKEKLKVLYMPSIPAIEERTRVNLKKSLKELGFEDTTEFIIADSSFPKTISFKLKVAKC